MFLYWNEKGYRLLFIALKNMQKPTNLSLLPFLKSLQNINHRVGTSLVWIKEKGNDRWMQGLGDISQF